MGEIIFKIHKYMCFSLLYTIAKKNPVKSLLLEMGMQTKTCISIGGVRVFQGSGRELVRDRWVASSRQSELPGSILRNSVESDHRCTSKIYFDNAGDNVTLTFYNMMLMSQKPC